MIGWSASQKLYFALPGRGPASVETRGHCYLCSGPAFDTIPTAVFVKPTFTDFNVARGDKNAGVCAACAWWSQEQNAELQEMLARDKPQKARNYSLFLASGKLHILSKAQKADIADLLLAASGLPEVAIIADSGQKHLVFKARVNPPGQRVGWVLFEEHMLWLDQEAFRNLFADIQALYRAGYSKESIGTGRYTFYPDSDRHLWRQTEPRVRPYRGSAPFDLALYLAQRSALEEAYNGDDRQLTDAT